MSGTERPLGRSGVCVPALGVGTNRWNAGEPGQARLNHTLAAALDVGMGFFDTAEVYSFGRSERALGLAARQDGRPLVLASKFAPLPTRLTAAQFDSALDRTLERLGRESLDLYYLHFPYSLRRVDTWMKAMAKAVEAGKIRAVGISNCNVARMRKVAGVLARYGIPLAANQVQYSLLHRAPETNGVLDACPRWTWPWLPTGPSLAVPSALARARAGARLALRTPCKKWRPPGTRPLFKWRLPGCSSETTT